jgi:cold-inducible RNA-binding protein
MSVKLYVGNLAYEVTEAELNELFAPLGVIESVKVINDRYTGNSKGFGFVEMSNREEADKAINELNGKTVRNRAIVVNEARPPSPRRSFGGARSQGGGRGSGRGRF